MLMKVHDRIWGSFEVEETAIIDVLNSEAIQRLKGISQFGLPYEYLPLKGFTRYEHSVGVMLLLRKLHASIEEQVAGLLHDVSHPAFSHLIDWVLGDRVIEDFQDRNHLKILQSPKLASILEKHSFTPEQMASYKNYSLLEQSVPLLCADRVDYALREFVDWAAPSIAQQCIHDTTSHDGKIVFTTFESAQAFGYNYMKLHREHWGGPEWMLRYEIFAQILKEALSKKIIAEDDLYNNESFVLRLLSTSNNPNILNSLAKLRSPLHFTLGEKNPTYVLKKKFRWVNPGYLHQGKVTYLMDVDKTYAQMVERERLATQQGVAITLHS